MLEAVGLIAEGCPLRLHLGCGETRLEGYVNVDIPRTEASLMTTTADLFGDIPTLRFPAATVEEVRTHHVFEHFGRVEAMALLVHWHEWLRVGGKIVIETPDLVGSARTLASDQPLSLKMAAARHLAGDQAEGWAYHVDHWFEERFCHTLSNLGFGGIEVTNWTWPHSPFLANVLVSGRKIESLSRATLLERADRLLAESAVAHAEARLVEAWRAQLRACLDGVSAVRREPSGRA
jgi:hypothetical protein